MCPKDPACVVGVASVWHWDDLGTLGQPWDVGPWDDIAGGPGPWDDLVGPWDDVVGPWDDLYLGTTSWDDMNLGTTWTLGRPGGTLGRPRDVGRPWDNLDL